jgi:hypothetical protein
MEDIIDIIVTETTNTIEITSQSTDEVIDVNIIDNREDIVLNVTPTVVEININSLTGNFGVTWGEITGTLSNQTDLNTALGLKADLVGGKVPSSQLPSYVDDVVEVANYAALPATGETGKIYVILDTNKIYRWSGSVYVEIADSTAVWGAITGTLSSQTDLQSALNAKFNNPTGDSTQYLNGAGTPVTFPIAGQSGTLVREVRNTTGATLTKGTIVYISGATGNKPTVSKALATGDSTSAQTFGMCQADISNNSNGYVVCVGDITGLDTSALTEGAQLYLSSTTAGTYTTTKQLAPAHLVYIGIVTRAHPTLGQIEVKIQNGYELDEIHDVAISSVANNQGIFYESSTSLWKNKSIATVLGYTPANGADYLPLTGGTLTGTLIGTRAEFTTSTLVDGVLVNNGSGRGIRIVNAGAGYGLIINNETASSAIPFLIQKSGVDKIYFTDAGAGNFTSSLTASSFIKSGGTSAQFLKANGSVDSSTYALDSAVVHNTGSETISGLKYFLSGTKNDLLFVSETVGYASVSGYSHFKANTNHVEFINSTNTKATKFIHGNAAYEFTMPNASGTIALTSNLSSYLPLSGGTLTGALSGTSASFSSSVTTATFLQASAGAQTNPTGGASVAIDYQTTSDGQGRIRSRDWDAAAWRNLTIEANNIVLTPSGKVAIGTTAPEGLLTIQGTSAQPPTSGTTANSLLQIVGSLGGQLNIGSNTVTGEYGSYIQVSDNNLAVSYPLILQPNGGQVGIGTYNLSSVGSALVVAQSGTPNILTIRRLDASNTGTGRLFFQATNASSSVQNVAFIEAGLESSSTAGYLAFASNTTERMRITSGGSLLIGATTGSGKLNITSDQGSNNQYLNFVGTQSGFSQEYGFGIVNGTKDFRLYDYTVGAERMRITSGGNIRYYITAAYGDTNLEWYNTSSNTVQAKIWADGNPRINAQVGGSGGVYLASGGTSWTSASDETLKTDLIPIENASEKVAQLRSVIGRYKTDEVGTKRSFLIAQDVMSVLPEAVDIDAKTGIMGVQYTEVIPLLVASIKELKAKIETLENK